MKRHYTGGTEFKKPGRQRTNSRSESASVRLSAQMISVTVDSTETSPTSSFILQTSEMSIPSASPSYQSLCMLPVSRRMDTTAIVHSSDQCERRRLAMRTMDLVGRFILSNKTLTAGHSAC